MGQKGGGIRADNRGLLFSPVTLAVVSPGVFNEEQSLKSICQLSSSVRRFHIFTRARGTRGPAVEVRTTVQSLQVRNVTLAAGNDLRDGRTLF